jgi:hypothetical protein
MNHHRKTFRLFRYFRLFRTLSFFDPTRFSINCSGLSPGFLEHGFSGIDQ